MEYDAATQKFSMTEEKAAALAHEGSPVYFLGAVELAVAMMKSEPRILEAFKTGEGVGWHEHDACLFRGTERFFRPGYMRHLLTEWIPSLQGVQYKLEAGANVADVGCGHGASTILMAQAFPKSHFYGFDYHQPSIDNARRAAEEAGVGDRVTFDVASAKEYPRKIMLWSHSSTVCMIWEIRRAHRVTFIRLWRRMAFGWWWNRSLATKWKTT